MKKSLFSLGAMIVGSVVFWFFYPTNYFPYFEPLEGILAAAGIVGL